MNAYAAPVGNARTMHPNFRQNIPPILQQRPQWIVWAGAKVPYNALTGYPASVTDSSTWTTFDAAANAYEANPSYSGLGFVFVEGGGLTGVDLDRKPGVELSDNERTAQDRIWLNFETYQEVSPSGTGLHVICLGTVPTAKTSAIEVYSGSRYFTFTGNYSGELRYVSDQQKNLTDLVSYLKSTQASQTTETTAELLAHSRPLLLTNDQVIGELQRLQTWPDIDALACGNPAPLIRDGRKDTSGSAIDMALVNYIAGVSGNARQTEEIWLSTLQGQRHKTKTNGGYRERTLARAFDGKFARPGIHCPIDPSLETAFASGSVAGAVPSASTASYSVGSSVPPDRAANLNAADDCYDIQPYEIIPAEDIPYEVDVYGTHHQKGLVSLTVAAGGTGKSSLTIIEALSMTTGCQLLRVKPERPLRVWLHNGEDPMTVLNARIAGAAKSYGLTSADTSNRLLVTSGHTLPLKIAKMGSRAYEIDDSVVRKIKGTIRRHGIEVMTIDPLMSFHSVPENDNGAMDAVIKELGKIASETGCAIDVVHHTTKSTPPGSAASRGASSIVDAVRAVRVLAHLEPNELDKLPVGTYLKILETKNNNNAKADKAALFMIQGEDLKNGGGKPGKVVPVVKTRDWPQSDAKQDNKPTGSRENKYDTSSNSEGVARAFELCGLQEYSNYRYGGEAWIGHRLAPAFGLNAKVNNEKVVDIVQAMVANGTLIIAKRPAPKNKKRIMEFVRFAETGSHITDAS